MAYTLSFRGLFFFFIDDCTLNDTINTTINMAVLEAFYARHRLYEKFWYPHPTKGDLVVRFNKPLEYKVMENGNGAVEPFTIELLLQP
ncbi:hypothetical protein [Mesorhizobium sp. STM 4661]|uniref:hypothetical protein n=1 Tax=Mesorhizobium sp. STM 4661 TaxID=1297570 RepID=UPI0002BE3E9E|nr:hypothetical protein [Mesorhizobium sp. STM 4661]CCV12928.1 hypothetical protein MESS4_510095 [Mesorhizobium sp. STM 4661]